MITSIKRQPCGPSLMDSILSKSSANIPDQRQASSLEPCVIEPAPFSTAHPTSYHKEDSSQQELTPSRTDQKPTCTPEFRSSSAVDRLCATSQSADTSKHAFDSPPSLRLTGPGVPGDNFSIKHEPVPFRFMKTFSPGPTVSPILDRPKRDVMAINALLNPVKPPEDIPPPIRPPGAIPSRPGSPEPRRPPRPVRPGADSASPPAEETPTVPSAPMIKEEPEPLRVPQSSDPVPTSPGTHTVTKILRLTYSSEDGAWSSASSCHVEAAAHFDGDII